MVGLFGAEEAKAHLLNVAKIDPVTPEQVLRDADALEGMTTTYAWKLYQKGVWNQLLTDLRLSLATEMREKNGIRVVTTEEREGARHRVLAHLNDLRLPYQLKFFKESSKRQKELQDSLK